MYDVALLEDAPSGYAIEAKLVDAVAAQHAGNFIRARVLYEEILRADPQQADALGMLGLLAQKSGDLAQARALIEAAIGLRPHDGRAHYNLAIVRTLQGDSAAAIAAYESAIKFAPDFADAHSNLGNLYRQTGRLDDALSAYAAAIRAKPDFAAVYCNLATVLIDLGKYDVAIRALETALVLAPDMPEAHANLGQAYRRSGRLREALDATRRALELRPNSDALLKLSVAAYEIDAFEIALDANRRVLELDPTCAQAHCNSATLYHDLGRYAEAIAACDAAIVLQPDFAEARVNKALSLLVCGDFARGWDEYAWVWRLPAERAHYPYLDRATLWDGETFAGRELLITHEQGFGDAIQVARYFPAIKARGGRVVLESSPELVSLFEGIPGIDELRVRGTAAVHVNDIDLHVPLMGLPRAFRTNLSSISALTTPYLAARRERVERWRPRLERPEHLRVGLVWAGNPGHANDRHRSVCLEAFAGFGEINGVAWFGLQKGRDETRGSCGALTFDPLGPEIADFADTAAIVDQLDLVISVDTSIVHLAGAMGKPVWTLLAFAPDWRWLLERSDSPWYPSMRLFRQPRPGDWKSVFAEVLLALEDFAV